MLITGHTGFLGSWLALWLKGLRAEVLGYAREPETPPDLYTLAKVADGMESILDDMRDFKRLLSAFDAFQPEVVIHLAGQSILGRAERKPRLTFNVNVQGTLNVLEAVRRTESVKAAAFASSGMAYENREWGLGYREADPLGGNEPLGASQAAAEMAVAAYRQSCTGEPRGRGVGLATFRMGNVIGGGDFGEARLLPDAVRAATTDTKLALRAPGARRPWVHVLDALSGVLVLASKLFEAPEAVSGAWNIGPDVAAAVTVSELAARFFMLLGKGGVDDASGFLGEEMPPPWVLRLASEKARDALGWCSVLGVEEAVAATAEWYRYMLLENGDARHLCLKNIGEYVETAVAKGIWWAES